MKATASFTEAAGPVLSSVCWDNFLLREFRMIQTEVRALRMVLPLNVQNRMNESMPGSDMR